MYLLFEKKMGDFYPAIAMWSLHPGGVKHHLTNDSSDSPVFSYIVFGVMPQLPMGDEGLVGNRKHETKFKSFSWHHYHGNLRVPPPRNSQPY